MHRNVCRAVGALLLDRLNRRIRMLTLYSRCIECSGDKLIATWRQVVDDISGQSRVVDRHRIRIISRRRTPIDVVAGQIDKRCAVFILGRRLPVQSRRAQADLIHGNREIGQCVAQVAIADTDRNIGVTARVSSLRPVRQSLSLPSRKLSVTPRFSLRLPRV